MGSKIIQNIQSNNLEDFLLPFQTSKLKFKVSNTIGFHQFDNNSLTTILPENVELSDLEFTDTYPSRNIQTDRPPNKINTKINQYLPEILVTAHQELDKAFRKICHDTEFQEEYKRLLTTYVGRPSPLYLAKNISEQIGGATIWFKREDLNHTGSHKINNAIGQALLAKKMGKHKIIAETGAGQHGIATATACCLLNLQCKIYMGSKDAIRQIKNVEKNKVIRC